MMNLPDFKSIKRGVKLEFVLRHYHVKLRRVGKSNIGDAAQFTGATDETPFT
jgi:hypothetical protein